MNKPGIVILALTLTACSSVFQYTKPENKPVVLQTKLVNQSRQNVWNKLLPELSKRLFLVDSFDKTAGVLSMSFKLDPEKYIDCGIITATTRENGVEHLFKFPASKAQQEFEYYKSNSHYKSNRQLSLKGRVNLVFEAVSPTQTRVTLNIAYLVDKFAHIHNLSTGTSRPFFDRMEFTSTSDGRLKITSIDGEYTECRSLGVLENEILSLVD